MNARVARQGRPVDITCTPSRKHGDRLGALAARSSSTPREQQCSGSLAERKICQGFLFQDTRDLVHFSPRRVNPAAQTGGVDEGSGHISRCGISSRPNRTDMDIPSTLPYFFLISSCLDFISALLKKTKKSHLASKYHLTLKDTLCLLKQRGRGQARWPLGRAR